MYSRRNNMEYENPGRDDGYYIGDTSPSVVPIAGISHRLSDRRSFSPVRRPEVYEIQPYISSADVHIFPESITVTPGRKTITVGSKGSPQFVPRHHQLARNPGYVEGFDDGELRRSGGTRPDMVYKTTMITQVAPRDVSVGRDSPLQQQPYQHGRQDSRRFHISVEPTSPLSQPEYVRYSPSPEPVQRSPMRKSLSNSDWSILSNQGHYLQCSPDRMVEISFRPQQTSPRYQEQPRHYQSQQLNHQQYQPQNQYHSQQFNQQNQSPHHHPSTPHHQYYPSDQHQVWKGHGEFSDNFHHPMGSLPQTPPPEPMAVPSRIVYSPQMANQNIAYSKKVEKKTPSHCSSIVIVPGGVKKMEEDARSPLEVNKLMMDSRIHQSMESSKVDKEAEVDELTNLLVQTMQMTGHPEFFGMCTSCGRAIMGASNGCSALGRLYHVVCFICGVCHTPLKQKPFFSLDGVTFCENCYTTTVERCSECNEPITEKMLRAVGKQFHPGCFKCCSCRRSLDGKAFTLDAGGQVFCLEDFNRRYAPRCSGCGEMIVPVEGRGDAERVVVLDRNYHLECHRCEDCGKLLSSRFGGDGCFPLDDSVLCGRCNAHRMERLTNPSSTNI